MGILDTIQGVLRKPQGVFTGAVHGFGKQVENATGFDGNKSLLQLLGVQNSASNEEEDELNRIFKDLDERGVDTREFEHLRPRAQSILSGAKEGWEGKIGPSTLYRQGKPVDQWENDPSGFDKALEPFLDIAVDPLMVAGGAGGAAKLASGLAKGGKVAQGTGKVVEGAGRFGKLNLPEETGRGAAALMKAGQYGRRGYQGLLASGGDPSDALMAASTIGGLEWGASSQLARAAASRLGRRGAGAAMEAVDLGKAPTVAPPGERIPTVTPEFPQDGGRLFRGEEFNDFSVSKAFDEGAGAATPPEVLFENMQLPFPAGPMKALPAGRRTPSWVDPDSAQEVLEVDITPATPMPAYTDSSVEELLSEVLPHGGNRLDPTGTQRPDALIRELAARRNAEGGRRMTEQRRRMLEQLQNNPTSIGQVMREIRSRYNAPQG